MKNFDLNDFLSDVNRENDIKIFKESVQTISKMLPMISKFMFDKYQNLVDAGFSKEEALSIIKVHGLYFDGGPKNISKGDS